MKLTSVILLLLLSSCITKAPDSLMDDVAGTAPQSWSVTKAGKSGVDADWVKRFNSSQLNRLVNEALSQNQDMKVASERVFRAAEAAGVADALIRPQVNLSTSGDRQKLNFIGFPFIASNTSNVFTTGLNVSWEPDVWGRYRAAKAAAIADLQAGNQDYRAAKASLAGQVCKAWFVLAEANEQVFLARKSLSLRRKTEESVRERFERDMREEGGSASQLRLAQTDVASAKDSLSARLGELSSAQRQLELLLGRYPSAKISGNRNLPSVPSSPPSGMPSELLIRRPDIIAAERRYAATVKRLTEAKLSAFPSFSLTSSGGTSTGSLNRILSSDFGVWSIGANALQPVLTGGRVKSAVRVQKSNQREALATLHKTVLAAFGEVEKTLAADKLLKRREGEIREARDLARDAARAAENDFQDGNGDVLTLFTAQSRSVQLNSQYTTLRRRRLTNRVDLHLALGGGFHL